MIRRAPVLIAWLLAGLLVLSVSSGAGATIIATTADNVCAPTDDPCNVTETVIIQDAAVLDFGVRTLNVTGGGKLDFADNRGTVLAGNINISVSGTGVKVRKSVSGEFIGGDATIRARRACSGDLLTPCLFDLTCTTLSLGTCTGGPAGTFVLDGRLAGNGQFEPAFVQLESAGDMTIKRPVEVSATGVDADSGLLEISSTQGSVTAEKLIELKGGSAGIGGDVEILAELDIILMDVVTVASTNGEDAEGGTITIEAGRNLIVGDDLNATGGSFSGGEISIDVLGDITIDGMSGNRATLSVSGQTFFDEFGEALGGDGGFLDITAGGDINFGQFSRVEGDGAQPEGEGGELGIFSDSGSISFAGDFFARGLGSFGGGGTIEFDAFDTLTIMPTGKLDASAGDSGGGLIELLSTNLIETQDGSLLDASANGIGFGGSVELSGMVVNLGGEIKASGTQLFNFNGIVGVDGCQIEVMATSDIKNDGGAGSTVLSGRGLIAPNPIVVRSGASFSAADGGGANRLEYIAVTHPPIVEAGAVFDPAAIVDTNMFLAICPGCGNGQEDLGETCDDANTVGGDGCSADCQLESCIAQSLDYPNKPLCNDDDGCTLDVCNTMTGNCDHTMDCSDGVPCTIDECIGMQCVSTPDDSVCDDGSVCTNDICGLSTGCNFINNSAPCNDGFFCNGDDTCSGGSCLQHTGDPCAGAAGECGMALCNEGGDTCEFVPAGTACSDDGNICTDDQCDGAGNCAHPANTAPCDDGIACTEGDVCAATVCGGTPNDSVCDDSNICTDEMCTVGVGCEFVNNTIACDDGMSCTVNDTCSEGTCQGTSQGCTDVCGDGAVTGTEECDHGAANGLPGDACSALCEWNVCGQPTGSVEPTASDSLFVLEAGVGAKVCDLCICDVTGDGQTNASDALAVIRRAVGILIPFFCPVCL